ncbi:MAG: lysophospholipid acyltransferase family protein [Spirochaetia bacterium]|jgi:1-acyl-sn-glycerol-3-phosphate acyltransferase|nr:lysophospholipid acyltransferase family protein [Spirochaetia bacterium]
MHFFTTIAGYLFAFPLLFIIMLLVLIQSFIGNQKIFEKVLKYLCRLFPALFGIKVKTFGLANLDPDKPHIFMSNHVNIFDGFILYGYIPNFFRGVELEDHFSWPVWGTITRKMGNIPISHRNAEAALTSLDKASTIISKGTSITILPEGHRTRDGKLQAFKGGPFRLAKKAKVDIIPIVMKGLWNRKSVHSKIVRPGTVELKFGDPVTVESYNDISHKELNVKVKEIILGMLEE